MQSRSCEQQAAPLSFMMREACHSEKSTPAGSHENMSEDSSSYELFYDSLSDIPDGDFSNDLSAFLSEEEISKSLELAHKSITNSVQEDEKATQEFTYYFNTSPDSPEDNSSSENKEQETSKRTQVTIPNSLLISVQPEQKKQNTGTYPQEANNFLNGTGKQSNISLLLPARPSFIRSLKNAERCGSKCKPASTDDVPFKNKLCDKAATLIEELSSIFREAAETRVRSPDGNSSSPDSGYLSPKNKQSTMPNSLRNPAHNKTCIEVTAKNEIPEGTDAGEFMPQSKEDCQSSECAAMNHVTKESHDQPSPPRFTQKLRSQEVDEGSKVVLECRVAGNPTPHVRTPPYAPESQNLFIPSA